MAPISFFLILFILHSILLLPLHSAHPDHSQCPSFSCGKFGEVSFPFTNTSSSSADFILNCTDEYLTMVKFPQSQKWYGVEFMNWHFEKISIHDQDLQDQLDSNRCGLLANFTVPVSPSVKFSDESHEFPFFRCKRKDYHDGFFPSLHNFTGCSDDYVLYFTGDYKKSLPLLPDNFSNLCSTVKLPVPWDWKLLNPETPWNPSKPVKELKFLWTATYFLSWDILPDCYRNQSNGGLCLDANGNFQCGGSKNNNGHKGRKIAIGVGAGVGGIFLACVSFFLYQRRKRIRSASISNSSQNSSPDHSLMHDIEKGSMSLPAPIFTYNELEEATNNFNPLQELGDGGFGTVYYGKLRDGRVVAVKRLYKNNYKRVQTFMNEVTILSHLRHPNLVALYGCTSRHGRELLLVYEFVPNGTVADHLHGQNAKAGLLTWPLRMTIAIECAEALAYLHASDIIHRDIKTNNILLDSYFHVKVADFGLSRLFPTDASHVSTAPQGTPGYVDPEYYQCYQLNNKSDVYSFGVVLIELISSKPAVDIQRHRHEINLASMAMNKIINHALHELVDPCLGFESDYGARRMITLVAELAFRCLQQDREMRPSMKEVLECLREIESVAKDRMVEAEEVDIINNNSPVSPCTVKDEEGNISITPVTSG